MPIEALRKVISIVFGAGITALSAYLLGLLILARLKSVAQSLTRRECGVFAFAIGAAALSNAVFFLCATGLVYDAALWGMAVLVPLAWWRWGSAIPCRPEFPREPEDRFWRILLIAVGIAYAYLYIPNVLAPETRADGYTYHLGLIGRYYRGHGFPHITTNVYAYLSQGAEMLYLFAYGFGRHSAAKLVHFSFFLATLWAMLLFARRHGLWRAGAVGVILYACSPVAGPDAASTYNDCAWAFYQFVVVYGLNLWWEHRTRGWLVVLGILAGFCFAVKYTGFLALPLVAAVVAWGVWRERKSAAPALQSILLVGVVSCVFILPWTLKNAWLIGNPVAPFFNRLFPNPYVSVQWEDAYREWAKHYSHSPDNRWQELLEAPLEVTVRGGKLGGMLGPIFLLAPLSLLTWRRSPVGVLWGAAFLFALPWFANVGTRFLIPSLIFVSLAMGFALFVLPRRAAYISGCALVAVHSLSSWPDLLPLWHSTQVWRLHEIPWAAALRLKPEYEYLGEHVPYYKTAQILAREASAEDRVFSLEPLAEAYFSAELIVSYQGAPNERLQRTLFAAVEPDLWPARELRLEWPSQNLRGFRIVQTNEHASSHWILSEVLLMHKREKIVPRIDWRIRAQPFPWTAAHIFDENPMTRWNSGQSLDPGMAVEVQFPAPRKLTGAHVIAPWGQHFSEFAYFGRPAGGPWVPLKVSSQLKVRPVSAPALKAWAAEALRRAEIDFLVINTDGGGHNVVSPYIADDPAAWQLQEVGQDGPVRIYRVL